MKINFKTRQLIRSATKGFLSTEFNPKNFKNVMTMMKDKFSYSTFTLTAFDYDLSPIILLSDLSAHCAPFFSALVIIVLSLIILN